MGVYLSAPILEKESFDEQCSGFTYGASSMQGWRVSQEDAHNCIPKFDDSGTSFFAVYDGHGGAEVAKYCHQKFPDFVKSMIEKKKEDDLTDLIQTAFLDFDATLTWDDVVKKLKELAGKDDDIDEDEDPDVPVGRTEADMLKAEADLPLNEVLAQYKSGPNDENTDKNNVGESSGCSSSQPAAASSSSSSSSHPVNGPKEEKAEQCVNNSNSGPISESDKPEGSGSKSKPEPEGSGSSPSPGGSAITGQRASKLTALEGFGKAQVDDDSEDDDDEDDEEDSWEDMSEDDDDDDEEDEDIDAEDVPMMDMTNEEPGSDSGCTACVVLKQKNKLYVANAGDSRCVLSRGGDAVELSFDHKPEDDPERERIEKAGGKVTSDGRVNGGLNLSRAIGDHVYKRNKDLPSSDQMISALPDVKTIELQSNDDFFVIACDGIWNFMTSQEVVDYIRERLPDLEKRKKPSLICEELFDHCLAPNILGDGTGCDNMTCIIVVLDSAQSDESNHKDAGDAVEENASSEEQKGLKRVVVDSTEAEQAKKVKVGEDVG